MSCRFIFIFFIIQFIQSLDTLILTDQNFDSIVNKSSNIFVVFYSPNCPHCRELLPHIDRISQALSNNSKYLMAKVDVSQEYMLSTRYEITRFPTLIFFVMGEKIPFNGNPKYNFIIEFIENILGPKTKFLEAESDIRKAEEENSIICIFSGKESDLNYNIFIQLIPLFPEIKFFHAQPQAIKDRTKKESKLILLKNFDEKIDIFNEDFTFPNIKEFVDKYSIPKILLYNIDSSKLVFGLGKKSFMVFRNFNDPNQKYLNDLLEDISEKYRGKLIFIDCDVTENSNIFKYLKVKEDNLPQIEILHSNKTLRRQKFIPKTKEKILKNELYEFINNYLKEEEILEKASIKEKSDSELKMWPIIDLDENSFNKKVLEDKSNDIIVAFYKKNNEEFQKFIQGYRKIATALKSSSKILFAQFELKGETSIIENFNENINLVLYRGDKMDESSLTFEGNYLNENEIFAFLKKNCLNKIDKNKIEEL